MTIGSAWRARATWRALSGAFTIVVAVGSAAALSSCGTSSEPSPTTVSSSPVESGAGTTPTNDAATTPATPVPPLHAISLVMEGGDGRTATATFSYGTPLGSSSSWRNGDLSPDDAGVATAGNTVNSGNSGNSGESGTPCSYDSQTTAVEPFSLEVPDTTKNFDEFPGFNFNVDTALGDSNVRAKLTCPSAPGKTDTSLSARNGATARA